MGDLLKIGASGLTAYQAALKVTGNNITKANDPGYSRQEVTFVARPADMTGAGYIGNGILADNVRRMADEFLTNQLRLDSSSFNRLDVYLNNASQLDTLLADESTGLAAGLERYFSAVQAGVDDPSSIAVRQLIVSEANGLTERFHTLSAQLTEMNDVINNQLTTVADQISSLAGSIAELNKSIMAAQGKGASPNDLMDQRDEKLRQLSEMIDVRTVSQDNGSISVFIGKGQPLVIGTEANKLEARKAADDPFRVELGFVDGVQFQNVNQLLTGGTLGGMLDFRRETLDRAFNEFGRIALAVTDSINKQQQMGLDLEGNLGSNFFRDINDASVIYQRATPQSQNALPDDRVVSVEIEDTSKLTTSDYILEIDGANYKITYEDSGKVAATGGLAGTYPFPIEVDGIRINLESGSFQDGDKFLIQPTRTAAGDMTMQLTRAQEIAFAAPITTGANIGNTGAGVISQGEMLSIYQTDGETLLDTFATPGQLSPPVVIRFTSETTYDVLDASDPANPVDLVPPMRGRTFIPGLQNPVFGTDPNQTSVSTTAPSLAAVTTGATNGFPGETITIRQSDPVTGVSSTQSTTFAAGISARIAAQQLSQLNGVTAYGDTSATLQITDVGATAMTVSLNGIDLTSTLVGNVPSPITADFLRDRINSSPQLQALKISATSDGTNLSVRGLTGEDLQFSVTGGDAGDGLNITNVNGLVPTGTTAIAVGGTSTVGGTVTVEMANSGQLQSSVAAPGGRFRTPADAALNTFKGYQVSLSGKPAKGDEFFVDFNEDGSSDNRNAALLAGLQSADTLAGGKLSFQEAYGQLVEFVGTVTSQTRINQEASEALMQQSQANRDSLSGVNLDEEAARLIQFEQAYNASAQVINIARQIFDALLAAF
jgi:flagellar hook-associated protein 1 FlgK